MKDELVDNIKETPRIILRRKIDKEKKEKTEKLLGIINQFFYINYQSWEAEEALRNLGVDIEIAPRKEKIDELFKMFGL